MPSKVKSPVKDFDIDVVSSLKWKKWEPGQEYTKLITLKNIAIKTKKLKYRIGNTQIFSTSYPQPIVLSSGMNISFPITFRPLNEENYEGHIEFTTQEGKFNISLKAVVPETQLQIPTQLQFGMCVVLDRKLLTFEIFNKSEMYASFKLFAAEPFSFYPSSGTLAPKTQCSIDAFFKPEHCNENTDHSIFCNEKYRGFNHPGYSENIIADLVRQEAYVCDVDAVCLFGDEITQKTSKIIKLEGIGKYPCLNVTYEKETGNEVVIDFGNVPLGETSKKTIEINNLTTVSTPFQVLQCESVIGNCFTCSLYHHSLPAECSLKLKISFKPENKKMVYMENIEIVPVGVCGKVVVKCRGQGVGPELSSNTRIINFGVANIGEEIVRSFKLKNKSITPAVFQLQLDPVYSVFCVNITSGVIAGMSHQLVIIKFIPRKPVPHYKKLFCLVHNQEPLIIEIFGSCVSADAKPAILSQQNIHNNPIHICRGISRLCPETILRLIKEKKILVRENNLLEVVDETIDESLEKSELLLNTYKEFFDAANADEMFMSHVTIDYDHLNFGRSNQNDTFVKTVNVINHTKGKVVCVWMNVPNGSFSVTPEESDISPLSGTSFSVTFKPDTPNKMYGAQIEAYVFYKVMHNKCLVGETCITPPWNVNVQVTGHTFNKYSELYLPSCEWDSKIMQFPPALSNKQSVYRTCLLTNNTETPIQCCFEEEKCQVFTCKPALGLIREKYHIAVFRMSLLEPGVCNKTAQCTLNDEHCSFELIATAETPQVVLTPDEFLYFKPTCVSDISYQTISVKNTSRVPLKLQWRIPAVDQNVLSVLKEKEIIQPHEIQKHMWSFTPNEAMKYLFKAKLFVSLLQLAHLPCKYTLRIIGESETGEIVSDVENILLESIIVGNTVQRCICLQNNSGCGLLYQLYVESAGDSPNSSDSIVQLDHYEALLPPHTTKQLVVSVTPRKKHLYRESISYQLKSNGNGINGKALFKEKKSLCLVNVQGVYPLLYVDDVRGLGCAKEYSKEYLTLLFDINNLNDLLSIDPDPNELKYGVTSKYSTSRKIPRTTHAGNNFDFGAGVYQCEDAIVYLNLKNKGKSPVQWVIRYPTDLQLDVDFWADNANLDSDDLHEMFVMDTKLFLVDPMKGEIEPGTSKSIKFTYRHKSLGMHKLPLLFKISQGREIMLHLKGMTLDSHIGQLHFTSLHHEYLPVSISRCIPLVQTYTLYNGSNVKVKFAFDISALDRLQMENWDWRVLECLTPVGEVGPFQFMNTHWFFSPTEAKEYVMNIPLVTDDGNTTMLSFTGTGYDPLTFELPFEERKEDKQQIKLPKEDVRLSTGRIVFGNIPVQTKKSQLVFLENVSNDNVMSYKWLIKNTPAEGYITVSPSDGCIDSQTHAICKVTIFSAGPPSMHHFDVICEVRDETLTGLYKRALSSWCAVDDEMTHLFTIKDVHHNQLLKDVRPGSGCRKLPLCSSPAVAPLPPINKNYHQDRVVIEERPCMANDAPVPPQAYHVILSVAVNTYALNDFHDNFKNRSALIKRQSFAGITEEGKGKSREEELVIKTTIALLLEDLLRDHDFIDSVERMRDGPLPYFNMFRVPSDEPLDNSRDTFLEDVLFEKLKHNPEFRDVLENVVENTIFNIMAEASCEEMSLTERPKFIVEFPNKNPL